MRFARGTRDTLRKLGGQSCTVVATMPPSAGTDWTLELRAIFCTGSYTVARYTVQGAPEPQRRVLAVATCPGAEGFELALSSANHAPTSPPASLDVELYVSDVPAAGVSQVWI